MSVAWVLRDRTTKIITAGCWVEAMDPKHLKEWKADRRELLLVDYGKGNGCRVGTPLSDEARILEWSDLPLPEPAEVRGSVES